MREVGKRSGKVYEEDASKYRKEKDAGMPCKKKKKINLVAGKIWINSV